MTEAKMKYLCLLLPFFLCASENKEPIPKKPSLVRRDRVYFGSFEGIPIEQILKEKRPRIVVSHPGKEEEKKE
jgi:hypothetical protein